MYMHGLTSCRVTVMNRMNSLQRPFRGICLALPRGPLRSGTALPRQRTSVTPAAGRRSSGGAASPQPDDGASEEALEKLSLVQLRALCADAGLPASGKKAELAARLAAHSAGSTATTQSGTADADYADAPDAAVTMSELAAALKIELASQTRVQLASCLAERGLPTAGSKEALAERLAEAIASQELGDAVTPSQPLQDDQQWHQQQPQVPSTSEDQSPVDVISESPAATSDRDWVIADKQQAMLDELLAMGVKRQELLDILSEMGQPADDGESLESLAERASWLLAEEELLLMEQQAAAAAAGTAAAPGDGTAAATATRPTSASGVTSDAVSAARAGVLDGLTATDINKMKVEDLRSCLRALGLSDEGGRYVLRDRLMTMLVVRRAASAGDMDDLLRQLGQMTLSELRSELERRGLDLAGSKAALETRLAQALVVEMVGPDAAAAAGALLASQGIDQEASPVVPLQEDYDELLTAAPDPYTRVALICGATAHCTGVPSTLSARTQRAADALATANALVDELHTAPIDVGQAAALEAAAAAAAAASSSTTTAGAGGKAARRSRSKSGGSGGALSEQQDTAASTQQQEHQQPAMPLCGVVVDVYWCSSNGSFSQLKRAALPGLTAASVEAAAPALACGAVFAGTTELAAHLAASGTHAALSLLPGGALALEGSLADALHSVGVPLAAGPAPTDAARAALCAERPPVLGGRSAALRVLRELKYPTPPLLELTRADVDGASRPTLDEWLAAQMSEDGASAEQPPAEQHLAEGDADGSEDTASGSKLLRAWNHRPDQQQQSSQVVDDTEQPEQQPPPQLVVSALAWCAAEGADAERQLFTLADATGGPVLAVSRGLPQALRKALALMDADAALNAVLLEPHFPRLTRWEVTVMSTAEDGPVALLPVEVEHSSVLADMQDAELALHEWEMLQSGMDEQDISAALAQLSATVLPCAESFAAPARPEPLPRHALRLHAPPRASAKLTHTIRHVAAKAVAQLGLASAGLVRVSGWLAPSPEWEQRYLLPDEALHHMPDYDAGQLQLLASEDALRRASEPLPLSDYYDEVTHMADLAAFDHAARCSGQANGEGDVLISSVELEVPLTPGSLAGTQAAEIGLGVAGVARHLVNLALLQGSDRELLPPPLPPSTENSAQWAQSSGANDTLADIASELAERAAELRKAVDTEEERASEMRERAAFAALPLEEAVDDVLTGLTSSWVTPAELAMLPERPEEWVAEDDVNAERDALRAAEDLAARDMRDEGRPFLGDQPVQYDRWDSGKDWVPPGAAVADALARGERPLSVAELREAAAAAIQADVDAALAEPHGPRDLLPDVSEDQIVFGRLLGFDRLAPTTSEVLTRAAADAVAAGEAAAAADAGLDAAGSASSWTLTSSGRVGSGGAGGDVADEEVAVAVEAARRRATQRVWVLLGGDGLARERAFRSGANAAAKLGRCADLQVDVFLLPPAGGGVDEATRRAALLARRTEWRALGISEEAFPSSMSHQQLVDMPPAPIQFMQRQLIVAGPQHLARPTFAEATEAAQRLSSRARMLQHVAPVLVQQQNEAACEAQLEVEAHYIQGVASAWGGVSAGVLAPPARVLDFEELLHEAHTVDATLLLFLDDSTVASGELQQALELAGIAHTGVGPDFVARSSTRMALSKAVDDIAEGLSQQSGGAVGLMSVPRKFVKTDELVGYLSKPQMFNGAYAALADGWQASSLAIKPPQPCGGMGVVRVSSADELQALTTALRRGDGLLPAGVLSQQQPMGAPLPLAAPSLLAVEPWLDTDAVHISTSDDGSLVVDWPGSSRWVELCIGLVGELGTMAALPGTLVARDALHGGRHHITPPPLHILPAAALKAAQSCAVALADNLGFRCLAEVQGFVCVDSGEMVVLDVRSTPDLRDGSPLLAQAAAHTPPLALHQLLRAVARDAHAANAAALQSASLGIGTGSTPGAYGAPTGLTAADFDLGPVPAAAAGAGVATDEPFSGGNSGLGGEDDEDMHMEEDMAAGWTL